MNDEEATKYQQRKPQLSAVVIALCKGMIDREADSKLWQGLLNLQLQVAEYVETLGLDLILDEAEGYAFLRAREYGEDDEKLPSVPQSYSEFGF